MKKKEKEYASFPIKLNDWDKEKFREIASRKTSVAFALRTITEMLEPFQLKLWKLADDITVRYNIDPEVQWFEQNGYIFASKKE